MVSYLCQEIKAVSGDSWGRHRAEPSPFCCSRVRRGQRELHASRGPIKSPEYHLSPKKKNKPKTDGSLMGGGGGGGKKDVSLH